MTRTDYDQNWWRTDEQCVCDHGPATPDHWECRERAEQARPGFGEPGFALNTRNCWNDPDTKGARNQAQRWDVHDTYHSDEFCPGPVNAGWSDDGKPAGKY